LADNAKDVFKLTITNNSTVIQGLLSLSVEPDHIYMHLLENAPFNIGQNKLYEGVAGNLVAYACKVVFQQGFDGFVSFTLKRLSVNRTGLEQAKQARRKKVME